jgi:hypothetical protein
LKSCRDRDRLLQLLIFNEEFLVNASHQLALITSLPFVHTARRTYRLNDPVRFSDWGNAAGSPAAMHREVTQTLSFRGRRSRNKVSVGEPAEGSLPMDPLINRVNQCSLWGAMAFASCPRVRTTEPRLGPSRNCAHLTHACHAELLRRGPALHCAPPWCSERVARYLWCLCVRPSSNT